jgi:succinate dehydrogenase flavin-adding protein (antitoxin of CptAB toxin-antitoxin module)
MLVAAVRVCVRACARVPAHAAWASGVRRAAATTGSGTGGETPTNAPGEHTVVDASNDVWGVIRALREPERTGEAEDVRRRRLRHQSKQRGWKENDMLLGRFAERHVPHMTPAQLDQYDRLLRCNDPDIFAWALQKEPVRPPARLHARAHTHVSAPRTCIPPPPRALITCRAAAGVQAPADVQSEVLQMLQRFVANGEAVQR